MVTGPNSLTSVANIIQNFERENAILDDHIQQIDDVIDDMAEEEGEGEFASDTIQQVLADIGIFPESIFPIPNNKKTMPEQVTLHLYPTALPLTHTILLSR